jgi:transposase InsO family protein
VRLLHNAELLNEASFRSLSHERELLAEWRADFNQNRPRTSLKRAHAE